jgi:hypothetical protein
LKLVNRGLAPVAVKIDGEIAGLKAGMVAIRAGGVAVWSGAVGAKRAAFTTKEFLVPASGAVAVEFASDAPGVRFANGDERVLAFAVYDVDIAVARAETAAKPAGKIQPR